VLADEGTRAEEIVVRPGETRNITLAPKPEVRFIGVAVLFQDIDRSQWRAVAAIAPSGLTRLVLFIGSNRATLEAA
jgi:type VI secretion system protein VasD